MLITKQFDKIRKDNSNKKTLASIPPASNHIVCNLLVISLLTYCVQFCLHLVLTGGLISRFGAFFTHINIVSVINLALICASFIGIIYIVVKDSEGDILKARLAARVQIVIMICSFLSCVMLMGLHAIELLYLFQFVCLVAYQIYNDPNLGVEIPWENPFKRRKDDDAIDAQRNAYIPLNFFNLFWIFVIAAMFGLAMETLYCVIVNNVLEDRAGLLYGPFSPIYGLGAVILTVVLNRIWNRHGIVIFVVGGIIGGFFEWFVSWYMEMTFGILAWDYSGSIGSIVGRTDLFHCIAWGLLALVWIRILLPATMKLVGMIKLKWRAIITIIAFTLMLVDACFTVLAIDCWSQRVNGLPIETPIQCYFEEHHGNDYMEKRFQTMTVWGMGHGIEGRNYMQQTPPVDAPPIEGNTSNADK